MPKVVDLLRPTWLSGINNVEIVRAGGVGGWIGTGSYYLSGIKNPDEFVLSYSDLQELAAAFACDVDRFGAAAVESALSCVAIARVPRSSAWLAIKIYYAAFFAAHALCRIAGRSFSRIDTDELLRLNLLLGAPGLTAAAPRGYYHCTAVTPASEVIVKNAGAIRGTHVATWGLFVNYIDDVIAASTKAPPTLLTALTSLMSLRDNLRYAKTTNGTWLSLVRNLITYEQLYGVWFPHWSPDSAELLRQSQSFKRDPLTIDVATPGMTDPARFIATCAFIVAVCLESIQELQSRCSTGKSFASSGSLRLYNQAAA